MKIRNCLLSIFGSEICFHYSTNPVISGRTQPIAPRPSTTIIKAPPANLSDRAVAKLEESQVVELEGEPVTELDGCHADWPVAELDGEPVAELEGELVVELDGEPVAELDGCRIAWPVAELDGEPFFEPKVAAADWPIAQLEGEPVAELDALKLCNNFLANNFEAWASNLGLAQLALDANAHVSPRVMRLNCFIVRYYFATAKELMRINQVSNCKSFS
ncbi:hypothetical protein Nepgr_010349 [Nepenthes gracilis]|uniref:Uncharacterized protein n=1 Tax=Nepenthes gracilis TaxID=150966 RepID=A0AAD3SD69_NEPGR|nr:hypothetical protein Nepgr_010349 [Nepenthes gracilis]